jgi:FMN phosphatase YigB (HAD superfamily)
MIGNDYDRDIKPAKQIGMKTILVPFEPTTGTTEAADFIIRDMSELEKVLKEFEGY